MEVQRVRRPCSIYIPQQKTASSCFESAIIIEQLEVVENNDDSDSDNEISLFSCPENSQDLDRIDLDTVWSIINTITARTLMPKELCRDVPMYLAMTGVTVATAGSISLPTKVKNKLTLELREMFMFCNFKYNI